MIRLIYKCGCEVEVRERVRSLDFPEEMVVRVVFAKDCGKPGGEEVRKEVGKFKEKPVLLDNLLEVVRMDGAKVRSGGSTLEREYGALQLHTEWHHLPWGEDVKGDKWQPQMILLCGCVWRMDGKFTDEDGVEHMVGVLTEQCEECRTNPGTSWAKVGDPMHGRIEGLCRFINRLYITVLRGDGVRVEGEKAKEFLRNRLKPLKTEEVEADIDINNSSRKGH